MEEKLKLTVIDASKRKTRSKLKEDLDKLWETFDGDHFDKYLTVDKEKTDAIGKPEVRLFSKWETYHADLLKLSKRDPRWAFELIVERPNLKFKIFYSNGMTRFCESLNEEYDETLLI